MPTGPTSTLNYTYEELRCEQYEQIFKSKCFGNYQIPVFDQDCFALRGQIEPILRAEDRPSGPTPGGALFFVKAGSLAYNALTCKKGQNPDHSFRLDG